MTALIRNFYKAIMQRLKTHEFGLRATSRIKELQMQMLLIIKQRLVGYYQGENLIR